MLFNDYRLDRVQRDLEELGHQIRWLMTGPTLGHGVCTNCQQTVVVEMSQGMRRVICDVLDQFCNGAPKGNTATWTSGQE